MIASIRKLYKCSTLCLMVRIYPRLWSVRPEDPVYLRRPTRGWGFHRPSGDTTVCYPFSRLRVVPCRIPMTAALRDIPCTAQCESLSR